MPGRQNEANEGEADVKNFPPSWDEKFRSNLHRNRALPTEEHSDFLTRAGFLTYGFCAVRPPSPRSPTESGCQSIP